MKQINHFLIAALLLFTYPVVAFAQINVPSKIDVHKPIILEASQVANVYIWNVPEPAIKITLNNGKTLHVWAPPGKYKIQLTTINVDFEKKDIKYNEGYAEFEVVGTGPVPPPTPNPNPDPTPTPVPVPTSVFKDKVKAALTKVNPNSIAWKNKLSEIYTGLAAEAKANPSSWDAAILVNEAKTRNTNLLPLSVAQGWVGFWPDLAKAMKELGLSASDLNSHIKAFEDIGAVLAAP